METTNPPALSSWSSLLKQQPPPKPAPPPSLPPLQQLPTPAAGAAPNGALVGSCKSSKGISVAVVDANAIIHGGLSLTHVADRFVSVSEVLSEVRDPNSRHSLNFLPFTVETLEPSPESLKKVISFARATGDLQTLSDVDLKLIALTYMLEAQTHGTQHIRDSPPPMHTVNVKRLPEKDLPGWGSNVPNIEEWEALENAEEGELNSESKILPLKDLNLNVIPTEQNSSGNGVETQSGSQGDVDDGAGKNKKYGTKKVEVKLEGKMVAEGVDASNGENDESAGDWQPAVCRTTKRRFLRRKARYESRQASEKAEEKELSDELESGNHDDSECPEVPANEDSEKVIVNALPHQLRLEEEEACDADAPHDNSDMKSFCKELDGGEHEASCDTTDGDDEDEDNEGEGEDVEVSSELDMEMPSLTGGSTTDGSHLDDLSSQQSWTVRSLSESSVACVTSDFAMQNVLLQMGLRILATGGMQIRELHRWVLKCHACNKVTTDIGRVFCPSCGNGGTLRKVAVTVGENGVVIASRKPRISTRGTKFSLPRPQGGRSAITKNPVLREDQLPQKYLYPKTRKPKKQGDDFYMPDDLFMNHGDKGSALQPPVRKALAVFSGRRNPNDNHYSRAKH